MRIFVNSQLDPTAPLPVALEDAPGLVLTALGGDPATDTCQVQTHQPNAASVGGDPPVVNYPGIQLSVQITLSPDDNAAWSSNEAARRVLQALGGKARTDSCTLTLQGEPGAAGTPPVPPAAPPAP